MNGKNLYDEGEINEEIEDDEIIDNDDEFEDSLVIISERKKEDNIIKENNKKENKNENTLQRIQNEVKNIVASTSINDTIKKNENNLNNNNNILNNENYSKEELITILMNNPIEKEEKNEKKLEINLNKKIKEIEKEEEEDSNFNKALTKVLKKIMKKKNNKNNNELYDIILNDKEIIENELKKCGFKKNINISSKIKSYIDKKNKNLNEIKQKKEEEFNQKYTFIPQINKKNNNKDKKRNLNQFLKDQEEYEQKKIEKILNIKDTQIKKEEEELKLKPKIQISSEKMAQEKYKGEEVFSRLYNQNIKKIEKENLNKNEKNRNSINNNINEEYLNNLYQDYKLREKKNKEKEDLENKKRKEILNYKAASTSNKYLYNKFKKSFKKEIEKILIEKGNNTKLNYNQLKNIFINLNFIPKSQSENENINNLLNEIYENLKDSNNLISIDHLFIFSLSIVKLFEYYIISNYQITNSTTLNTESLENNKKEISNSISQKDLKINIISNNKLLHKNNSVLQVNSLENNCLKLDYINKELQSRIIKNMKFGGFDSNNNFIITCTHAEMIFKNFLIFYQNYSNPNINKENNNNEFSKENIKKKQMIRASTSNSVVQSYKSNLLLNKQKINDRNNRSNYLNQTHNTENDNNKKQKRNKSNSSLRIEQLYLSNSKKKNFLEKEKEKYLEQKEKEEKINCTFKPKINSNAQYKNNIIPIDKNNNNNNINEKRMDYLFKKGTEKIINKKDKTLDEIEVEKYKKELTFKPQINNINYEVFKKNCNVENDYDIQKFNQRLLKGREEREIKESAFERGEFLIQNTRNLFENNNLNHNKTESNKNNNKRSFIQNSTNNLNKTPIRNQIRSNSKNKNNKLNNSYINNKNNKLNNNNKTNNNIKTCKENPILQIDINLKHGLKKKVYVYEGDTSESLAKNFSLENGLDDKMRKKLQNLIQQEMDKLLTRIEEESRSTFKSNHI